MNHTNGVENTEKVAVLDAGAQYGKVGRDIYVNHHFDIFIIRQKENEQDMSAIRVMLNK